MMLRDSIQNRERKIFGTLSFVPAVVATSGKDDAASTELQAPRRRRDQISRAQKTHRKRQKEYMNALEEEVLRLRERASTLDQEATYWKRCALAALSSRQRPAPHDLQLGPGLFLWTVSSLYESSPLLSLPQPPVYSSTPAMSQLAPRDALLQTLLQNFLENIMPSLNVTENKGNGYEKYVVPLALDSEVVLSSFLAASASHMQLTKAKTWAVHRLKYRMTAIAGLREASKQEPDAPLFLSALATILGLMVEDIISSTREFPQLLDLSQYWTGKGSLCRHEPQANDAARFLLDQMQMLKALVYPLYQFDWSLGAKLSSQDSANQQSSLFDSPMKLYETFRSMEEATSLACEIYKLSSTAGPNIEREAEEPESRHTTTSKLLDALHSVVLDIPPSAVGENSLVWVYYVAAGNSTLAHHRTFFTTRLEKLLGRLGHDNTSVVLASAYKQV